MSVVVITGAAGLVGSMLRPRLARPGRMLRLLDIAPLTAGPGEEVIQASVTDLDAMTEACRGADAVIHLAGEPVAQKWSAAAKQKIRDSRVKGTERLIQALSTISQRPPALISASAIGIYGSRNSEILTETSPPGAGFLADLCQEWEKEADMAESLGMRVAKIRIGIVLDKNGGALAKMPVGPDIVGVPSAG